MTTLITLADVLATLANPGDLSRPVVYEYQVGGVTYSTRLKVCQGRLMCPCCGDLVDRLHVTDRGPACPTCWARLRRGVAR